MAAWRERIALNHVIEQMNKKYGLDRAEDDCPEEVKEAIATELLKSRALGHYAGKVRKVKAIAALSRLLSRIYDDADQHLVWCYAQPEAVPVGDKTGS